jgi:hypothetical protein
VTFLAAKMDCAKGSVIVQENTNNSMDAIPFIRGAKLGAEALFLEMILVKEV